MIIAAGIYSCHRQQIRTNLLSKQYDISKYSKSHLAKTEIVRGSAQNANNGSNGNNDKIDSTQMLNVVPAIASGIESIARDHDDNHDHDNDIDDDHHDINENMMGEGLNEDVLQIDGNYKIDEKLVPDIEFDVLNNCTQTKGGIDEKNNNINNSKNNIKRTSTFEQEMKNQLAAQDIVMDDIVEDMDESEEEEQEQDINGNNNVKKTSTKGGDDHDNCNEESDTASRDVEKMFDNGKKSKTQKGDHDLQTPETPETPDDQLQQVVSQVRSKSNHMHPQTIRDGDTSKSGSTKRNTKKTKRIRTKGETKVSKADTKTPGGNTNS